MSQMLYTYVTDADVNAPGKVQSSPQEKAAKSWTQRKNLELIKPAEPSV